MGKILEFRKSDKIDHIIDFLNEHREEIVTCFLFNLGDDGSGNVSWTISNKHDILFILGELVLFKDFLIDEFNRLDGK